MTVYAPRAQKETEGQKISEAKTEEQGTKAEKPKPQVRFAPPPVISFTSPLVSAPTAHTTPKAWHAKHKI